MNRSIYYLYGYGAVALTGLSLGLFGFFLLDNGFVPGPARPETMHKGLAILIDLGLITLFGAQHSLMARQGFKEGLRKYIPTGLERSTYVLASALVLVLLVLCWRGVGGVIWEIRQPWFQLLFRFLFFGGALLAGWSAMAIRGADLTGLEQLRYHTGQQEPVDVPFQTPGPYRWVRHPIYLGTLLVLWAHPVFTYGHALLALGFTVYIFIGIRFEEKDLIRQYGPTYREYKRKVPGIFPDAKTEICRKGNGQKKTPTSTGGRM